VLHSDNDVIDEKSTDDEYNLREREVDPAMLVHPPKKYPIGCNVLPETTPSIADPNEVGLNPNEFAAEAPEIHVHATIGGEDR
jgi:hypothetical protein